jgi:hypothetical protein
MIQVIKAVAMSVATANDAAATRQRRPTLGVMPGLVPGIHVFARFNKEDVDGRDKPGHDAFFGSC